MDGVLEVTRYTHFIVFRRNKTNSLRFSGSIINASDYCKYAAVNDK